MPRTTKCLAFPLLSTPIHKFTRIFLRGAPADWKSAISRQVGRSLRYGQLRSELLSLTSLCLGMMFVSVPEAVGQGAGAGQGRRQLHGHIPAEVAKLKPMGRLSAETNLNLAIGLPLRDPAGLTNFLHELYDPSSTNYHHYLTPEQFTERFGPTQADYDKVIAFAKSNHLTVTATHPNRVILDVRGSVADIERAFGITLRLYRHPTEPRQFFSPDAEPSVPEGVPIHDVSGLENFMPPRPMSLHRKGNKDHSPLDGTEVQSYATGSGPGGDFLGYDFRAAYAPGVLLTGVGQAIGLFEFGPYFTNDIILYKQAAGLPAIVVTNVLLDGFTGVPAPGTDDGEEALDIDMAMCMAPGATIIVYEGNSAIDIFNRMATDNQAKQLSCSFGFYPPPGSMDTVFAQFMAQGQSFFVASGDSGAYSTNLIFAPADDPNITSVGGTKLTTTGPFGAWVSETTWGGSGGGITPHYTIPSYQAGMDMSTNHGSITQRNFPDVSTLADTVIFWYLKNGQSGTVGGTSAAAPLWAGFMALVNQQAAANGRSAIGNLNTVLYGIGRGSNNYATIFHDITTGNNFNTASPTNFPAVAGYDLATGWGTPNGSNMINVLAAPTDALQIMPGTGFTITTPFGVPFGGTNVIFSLTNAGAAPVTWSLANTSVWLTATATTGLLSPLSPATNVTVSLNTAAATNFASGTYYATVLVTNTTSGVVETRLFTLNVSAANYPLTFTGLNAGVIVPTNGTVLSPKATGFDIANAYAFYQAGLSGGGKGLPQGGVFTSHLDGATVFQFGPYGATNVLQMGDGFPTTGTLTLGSSQSYNSIAVLASSANGGGSGTLVLNFADGTHSQTFNFNDQDWFNNSANVALQGFGRLKLTTFSFEDPGSSNPNLYQTTINLAASGLNQPLASISFTNPPVGGNQDSAIFAISGALMPAQVIIIQQPQSVTNSNPSAGVTIPVVAMGAPPLTYQWYNGTPGSGTLVAGQTAASLNFTPVTTNQAGNYFVVITNAYNAVTSTVATLTVLTAPLFTQQPNPTNLFLFAGQTARFSAVGAGATPLTYTWRFNGTAITGATTNAYTITSVQLTNTGNYSLRLSNAYGMATSSVVSLTVTPAPTYPFGQGVLADHPMAYWRLDETNGTIAHDYVGGLNGSYTNALLGQAGDTLIDTHKVVRFGNSGNTSMAGGIPIDFATNGNAEFSVEAWANGAAQTTDCGLVTKGTGAGGEQLNLDCGSGSHAFRFFVRDASGGVHLANGTIGPNSAWHHLVGVCDEANGKVILYVDGVSNASGTITAGSGLLSSANALTIGSRQSGTTTYDAQFVGLMEEVAIYNYVLTPARIQAHYAAVTNRPPVFFVNPFTEPGVNAGAAYSANMATNASDPNGDTVTFAKVTGPAWLTVAGNGALSGTPANSDAGTNSFVVSARDPAGLSNSATMFIYVNGAPYFLANPFSEPDANAGVAYSANISTNASDPNGDPLTFAKVSGAAWLAVAGNGALSGTPLSADVGTNSFTVNATDPGGLSTNATMNINVIAAPPIIAAVSLQTTNLFLSWAGGIGPYQVQMATNFGNPIWQTIAGPLATNSISLTISNDAGFYRVVGR
ncbi:MAG: hypothetical protein C5B50_13770 [Verrucomicrobia bacterium]|nr:MAG: hypothetical protein C5B50_13770 [Verrucomicrobiota bacterium]